MTIYLVRHASAGARSDFEGPDSARPLDPRGWDQAEKLRAYLGGAPIARALSSPSRRCQQTLGPLAHELGIIVEDHDDLVEGVLPAHALTLIRELAQLRTEVVLCSHGDVIPPVIEQLAASGTSLIGARKCAKGSVWTLHTEGDEIVRAHYAPM